MAILQVVEIKEGKTSIQNIAYTILTLEEVISMDKEIVLSGKRATRFFFGDKSFKIGDLWKAEIKKYSTTNYSQNGKEYDSISIVVFGDENGLDLAAKALKYYDAFPYDDQGNIYNPIKRDIKQLIERAKQIKGNGGESSYHLEFKEFVSNNPIVLGLSTTVGKGQTEYCLPSTDLIDIVFVDNNTKIGVEVKSRISDAPDILRGLFQCVKYKCLIEAEQIVINEQPDSRVILALESQLPVELIAVKNILGIEVFDKIEIPN